LSVPDPARGLIADPQIAAPPAPSAAAVELDPKPQAAPATRKTRRAVTEAATRLRDLLRCSL
jgi:hypothetical protein